jgi:membrane-bound ClpP family serine protease
MYTQGTNSASRPLVIGLIFWISMIFVSFGLFAPRNATVIAAYLVAALSVSGAILMILEMYTPYSGLIELSSAPLRAALEQLGN